MKAVYQIRNLINNKRYIGSTKDVIQRWKYHKDNLQKNRHGNQYLQHAWNKYGENNFVFEIIEEVNIIEGINEKQQLYAREDYYFAEYKPEYNIGKKAEGGDNLTNHPRRDEIIKKRSETNRKVWEANPEKKKERSLKYSGEGNPRYGIEWIEESRNKLKNRLKLFYLNNQHKNKGKSHKEIFGEEKAAEISKALSDAAKLKMGELNPFYGKTHSEETRKLLSKKMKGKKPTNRRKIKIGELIFDSVSDAAKHLNVCSATIIHRINSPNEKYKEYFYL